MTLYECAMELLGTYGDVRVSIEWGKHYLRPLITDIPIMYAMREVDAVNVDNINTSAGRTVNVISIYLKEEQS